MCFGASQKCQFAETNLNTLFLKNLLPSKQLLLAACVVLSDCGHMANISKHTAHAHTFISVYTLYKHKHCQTVRNELD